MNQFATIDSNESIVSIDLKSNIGSYHICRQPLLMMMIYVRIRNYTTIQNNEYNRNSRIFFEHKKKNQNKNTDRHKKRKTT